MMRRLVSFLVIAAALSGCMDGEGKSTATTGSAIERPPLEGYVLDAAAVPVEGTTLRIEAANASATAGPDGYYSFAALPTEVALVVVAEATGYKSLSKSVTLAPETSLLLNFTLEAVPVKVPDVQMTRHRGLLACEVLVYALENEQRYECGGNDPNNAPRIEFAMGPDVAGVVFELVWDPATALAEILQLTVETVGFGDQDEVLADIADHSVLRTQINSFQAAKYYSQGGIARATVAAGVNPDEEESTVGSSVPFQQPFDLYVSVFYVEGPAPTYTALA